MGAIHVLTFMVVRNGAGLFDGLRLQKNHITQSGSL